MNKKRMNEFYVELLCASIVFEGRLIAFSLKAKSITKPDHANISPQKINISNIAFIQGSRKKCSSVRDGWQEF